MALLSESVLLFVFFNDTATTEIYTLSLHDALPIYFRECRVGIKLRAISPSDFFRFDRSEEHTSELQSPYVISYAVFCLKKYAAFVDRASAAGRAIDRVRRSGRSGHGDDSARFDSVFFFDVPGDDHHLPSPPARPLRN